ncbi:hypothetical protein BJX61DRAFT_33278 [Aspergillus egyptiacus]|nr:hypothetical protein BJX61DRAFT_33278 [Aspergillus egyptiacus]
MDSTGSMPESPENDRLPVIPLRSATPSESSPTKPLPEAPIESLSLPEWRTCEDSVVWFTQLRKIVKSFVYRYCSVLQKALGIFERSHANEYSHYRSLQAFLRATWARWLEFVQRKSVTSSFLLSCLIHDDLLQPLSWMRAPRKASKRLLEEMAELRTSIRSLVHELFSVRGLVDDALARLEEANDGHEIPPFIDLPAPVAFDYPIPDTIDTRDDPASCTENRSIENSSIPDNTAPRDDDEDSSVDEDIDLDEQLFAEGGIKNWEDLEENGFDPLWIEGRYPGPIPEEISEYLEPDERRNKTIQVIGSNRSIFWLFGLNDFVTIIDDPACLLEDEIVLVPAGIHPIGFLVDRYAEEQKLPGFLMKRYEKYFNFYPHSRSHTAIALPLLDIPSRVTDRMTRQRIPDLYPLCRMQTLPETILCSKTKYHKSKGKLKAELRNKLEDSIDLGSGSFLFRGLTRRAAYLSMSLFLPVISTANFDHEFGPGIYASDDLSTAIEYAGINGAIMVFKDTDFRGLSVWNPDIEQWRTLLASWLQIPLADLRVPDEHKRADVIRGPLSEDPFLARRQKRFPKQGDETQTACVSYESCKRLASSLVAIIYLTS